MWKHDQASCSIQGQLLRLGAHRVAVIYLREGAVWVADFVDGKGALSDVRTWLRFNCGTTANAYAIRRTARECAIPLSAELVSCIEWLHQAAACPAPLSAISLPSPIVSLDLRRPQRVTERNAKE
jgi:hypothetical protein